jgi:hypothetical protein
LGFFATRTLLQHCTVPPEGDGLALHAQPGGTRFQDAFDKTFHLRFENLTAGTAIRVGFWKDMK